LLEVMLACAHGELHNFGALSWSDEWAVSVVLASAGYPGDYQVGKVISGIANAQALPGVTVYHAGTRQMPDGSIVTAGGRVLNITALGSSFEQARQRAYVACEHISFEGKQYRGDIGARALRGRDAWND
jgi:phosphoribosylamine--glycine ligase